MGILLTVFVIFVTGSERRIPIQYSQKTVGRKMYGGQSTHLPLKVNMTGVMPIIFASSIVSLLPTILTLCQVTENTAGFWGGVYRVFAADGAVYPIVLFILIIAFAYFYTQITFNPVEVANNIKDNGGVIRGIKHENMAGFIRKRLNRVTLIGALFLGIVAVLPIVLGPHAIQYLLEWIVGGAYVGQDPNSYMIYGNSIVTVSQLIEQTAAGFTSTFTFGGTTLLIVVGVAIETFRELEAQLAMRNFKGSLK